MTRELFCNWDARPAILVEDNSGRIAAVAVLTRGGDWTPVDALDVWRSANGGTSPEVLRAFEKSFGSLDVPSGLNIARSMLSSRAAAE